MINKINLLFINDDLNLENLLVSEVFKDKEQLLGIVGDSKTVVYLFVVTLLIY